MLWESASAALASVIEQGAAISDSMQWQALVEEGQRWKPVDFDAASCELRHYYEGKFGMHVSAEASRRYPFTGHRMPRTPFNWAKLHAENAASVFDLPPDLFLENESGARLSPDPTAAGVDEPADDAQRAADFATMIDESQIQLNLAEAERRAAICGDCFVRAHSDAVVAAATGDEPITALSLFFPDSMLVIPHPSAPTSIAAASAILARVADDGGVGSGKQTWEAWTRSYSTGEGGLPVFGPWSCDLVEQTTKTTRDYNGRESTSVEVKVTSVWGPKNPYPHARAPWVVIRSGVPQGCPFTDPNRNLVAIFDALNTSIMAEQFAVDMGSASVLVRRTDRPAPTRIVLAAGSMANVKKDEEITSVPQSTDFAGIRGANAGLAAMLAITSRQPIGAFSVDATTQPKSGTALRIEREPQTKQRTESIARMRPPVEDLLYIMCEIHDDQRGTNMLGGGAEPCFEPQDPPEYEDLAVTQQRAFQMYDAGKIYEEMLLVMCRFAPDEESARAIIDRAKAEKTLSKPSAAMGALDAAGKPTTTAQSGGGPAGGDGAGANGNRVTVVTHERMKPGGDGTGGAA